ncbi:MAG: ABC transporter ATP-binding protein [Gammaproteobacteria bacterium]|nr:ABC transporter ATP-binding protein [Gammaproteobacteria bacterium]
MTKALSIQNLYKTYSNGFEALRGISLDVEDGDFFALLGPNGAGKSTTIGIVTSLINKSGGQVQVYGHDIDSEIELAKQNIGIVPQEFNFNVFEPVEEILINQAGYYGLSRSLATERAHHYLKQLGLWEKRRVMARELSGGMKRRLMIARALVHEPRLLILDEPTAGVDIEIRRSTWEFLTEINKRGTTIILTTHYLEEAEQLCRNIAIIARGEIVENTSIRELLARLKLQTFIVSLDGNIDAAPQLDDFVCAQVDDQTLEIQVREEQSLNELFEQLQTRGIRVKGMRNKSNRLEELFMQMLQPPEQDKEVQS